jgi:YbbR domain-containing protein
VSRLLGAIVYNWPLKLAAIALAVLLYVGLIVSENAQTKDNVGITIQPINPPLNTILIGTLGEVTNIRYFVADPANVPVQASNFSATVDLSSVQPGPEAQSVRVQVASADPRIQVISANPAFVSVHLERVEPKDVPVDVVLGPVPDGLAVGKPESSITTATVLGAATDIARVTEVRANVSIDSSELDVDRDFTLIPVDELGEKVPNIEVDPATVRVQMAVFKDRGTATVPITPSIVGTLPPGFEVGRVTLSSPTVSVQGNAANLADIVDLRTAPISVDGRTADFDVTVGFDLPQGVTVLTPVTVGVHVPIRPVSVSRTYTAGIVVTGARPDLVYALSVPQALVTIGGSPVDLDRLNVATLSLSAKVDGLDVGSHTVQLSTSLPAGLSVVAISPAAIVVTVSEASPASSGGPPPSAGG